uniref:Uncharacterized protein n=1 Tax=Loxodonta africana TaxID=9785 RepID=G3UFS7_LOXAF
RREAAAARAAACRRRVRNLPGSRPQAGDRSPQGTLHYSSQRELGWSRGRTLRPN